MQPELQLNEFFVEGGNQEQSHVLLHITEPSTPEEQAKGYFFAICEINNAASKYITKLQDIIDNAENSYYETERQGEKSPLEVILEKMNQDAFALVDDGIELHCIIGAIYESNIVFTYHGHPQALLFYRNRQNVYQKMDLVAQNPEDASAATSQLFSDVIQGKISVHDYLFLSTPHLTNYFTHDRIQKVITVRPANQSAQHFEHVLSELREGYSFGGLVVHLHEPQVAQSPIKKVRATEINGSEESMQSLFSTQRNTAATLSPPLFPRQNEKRAVAISPPPPAPKVAVVRPSGPTATNVSRPHRSAPRENEKISSDTIISLLRKAIPLFTYIGRALVWLLVFVYSGLASIIRNIILLLFVIINYQNRRKLIVEEWRRHWRSRKEHLRQMPFITKVIAVIVLLVVIGFAGGISVLRYRAKQQAELKVYQDTLNQIKTKRDASQSNLIYRNESAAVQELQGAEALFAHLPCVSKEEKINCTNLRNDLDELSTRLRKITTVTPELVTSIPSFASSTALLLKVGNKIIAASAASSVIMSYDIGSKNTQILGNIGSGVLAMSAPKENDYILIETANRDFVKLDPASGAVTSSQISFPHIRSSISAFVVYNRKLYTLDQINNQIYKHVTIRNGFDIGKEWIKTPGVDLQNAVAMSVDGDMYIAKSNGELLKFTSGDLQNNFTVQGIDPALTSADRIWTYTEAANVYVLDSAGKRLIVLDKNGQLKQQITATGFARPTDMIIDEPGKTAYIIDSGKLYKIPLTF